MNIAVSVIVPVYNAEKYLSETMNGIAKQTLKNIEIIVIDDGSTDGSAEIIREFLASDTRIILKTQEHSGTALARNKGIEMARGKYLSLLDADDLFEPDMLKQAYNEAEKYEADLVIFDNDRFDSKSGNVFIKTEAGKRHIPQKNPFSSDDVRAHQFTFSFNVAWNMLLNRKFVLDNNIWFQNIEQHNDSYFSVCCKLLGKRMCYLNQTLLHYRKNVENSISCFHMGKKDSFSAISAMSAIHDRIKIHKDYDKMLPSFILYSSDVILFNLNRLRGKAFFEMLRLLKSEWFPRFPAEMICADVYESNTALMLCRSIMEDDDLTYLFLLLDIEMRENQVLMMNKQWVFADIRVKPNDRIIIYGAGDIGRDYFYQLNQNHQVFLVDGAYKQISDLPIEAPENIKEMKYDWIIIATNKSESANQIRRFLKNLGVEEEKIIIPIS